MRKKIIGSFCLILICCSSIFGHSLINIIYDGQGNKISLYDDYTWVMNDKEEKIKNKESQYYGKYILKEKGMQDAIKMGLIGKGIYPGSDEWLSSIALFNIAIKIYTIEDLTKDYNLSFNFELENNKYTFHMDENGTLQNYSLDRIDPSSNEEGYYIEDNKLFISHGEKFINSGNFENDDTFVVNMRSMDITDNTCNGYEKYAYITLEKE